MPRLLTPPAAKAAIKGAWSTALQAVLGVIIDNGDAGLHIGQVEPLETSSSISDCASTSTGSACLLRVTIEWDACLWIPSNLNRVPARPRSPTSTAAAILCQCIQQAGRSDAERRSSTKARNAIANKVKLSITNDRAVSTMRFSHQKFARG